MEEKHGQEELSSRDLIVQRVVKEVGHYTNYDHLGAVAQQEFQRNLGDLVDTFCCINPAIPEDTLYEVVSEALF